MNWVRQKIKNKIIGILSQKDIGEQQLRMLSGWTDTRENFRKLMKEMEENGAIKSYYWDIMDELKGEQTYKAIYPPSTYTTQEDMIRGWLSICASNSDKTVKELLERIGKDESWLWELINGYPNNR